VSSDNILILPVWKKGASAEEWFYEMSPDDSSSHISYFCHGVTTTEAFGLLEIGKFQLHDQTHRP
jgi:hypothetical protein